MTLKKMILHVGSPKTGTTALQSALSENESGLKASGVQYLRSFRRGISHNYLMKLALGRDTDAFLRRKIDSEIDQASSATTTLLVSSETAYGAMRTKRLLEVLPTSLVEDATVVLYFRRQDLFMESMAKQKSKNGANIADFRAFIQQRSRRASYMSYVHAVGRAHPGIKFECRIFDRKLLVNADIVSDFFENFLPVSPEEKGKPPASSNKTPTVFLCEAMANFPFENAVHRRATLRKLMSDRPDFFGSRDILDQDTRRTFMDLFKSENEELSEYCGYDLIARFHDDVDWNLESKVISDPTEIKRLQTEVFEALVSAEENVRIGS